MTEHYAIALGFFDGVHLGHQALIRRTVERAAEHGLIPAVFTFDRSPREFITGVPVPLLTTPEERCRIFRELFGIEKIFIAPFNEQMMQMGWDEFLTILKERFGASWFVAGEDHRFGHKNQGNAALLKEWCAAHQVGCDVIPPVKLDGVTVSSTYIRSLLEAGDREKARCYLGHNLLSL